MRTAFTRTPTGIVGARFFYPKPIVWVEGPTDIYFYEPVIGHLNCVLKYFAGCSNSSALIQGLRDKTNEYPYAVILDGDYTILNPRRSVHRWVITLKRYSIENYLWEKEPLNNSCLRHAQVGEQKDVIGDTLSKLEHELQSNLLKLIILDIAARRLDPSPEILPNRIDRLLIRSDGFELCKQKCSDYIKKLEGTISDEQFKEAERDVKKFLSNRPFVHLLKGHILFGIMEKFFTSVTTRLRKKKVILNHDVLMQLLSDRVWKLSPSKDHQLLRNKLISVVREIQGAPQT